MYRSVLSVFVEVKGYERESIYPALVFACFALTTPCAVLGCVWHAAGGGGTGRWLGGWVRDGLLIGVRVGGLVGWWVGGWAGGVDGRNRVFVLEPSPFVVVGCALAVLAVSVSVCVSPFVISCLPPLAP